MAAISSKLFAALVVFYTLSVCAALFPTRLIYETPNPAWFENLAIRRDGSILATTVTAPTLYLVRPDSPKQSPKVIEGFNRNTGLLGITEITPDAFVVAGSNFSLTTQAPAPNSSYLYLVTFPSHNKSENPTVTVAAYIPKIALADGIVTLNNHTILVADPPNGAIWSVNIETGVYDVVSSDPLLKGTGVDGLKLHDDKLYFTDTSERLLGRFTINPKTGIPKGNASVVARYPNNPPVVAYDDFALSRDGKFAYPVVAGGNSVTRVNVETGKQVTIAGDLNSTTIAQPTSAAFGRNGDEGILYVTTAGGLGIPVNGNETVGGQIVAVKVGKH
ncbi:hypothetical protein ACLMJK_005559 [Lecanora helva]